jgi:hypothetical protein
MARSAGMKTREVVHTLDETNTVQSSRWMVCSRSEASLKGAAGSVDGSEAPEILWTDDRNDLFSILKIR